ncbi:hypothetical protein [Flammeovirga sp. SJP92]|uniref:hypothetical protein n=1 Tax=Flammeovirga sp. SJP92 TaxID=1775430 RepID=UPI0007929376|nr:hypothetical protein [Flammeovirga sp. SJP92]KXX69240.1 hypothetical protein AVL50_16390 [Flammeovirga sp. SJP92]
MKFIYSLVILLAIFSSSSAFNPYIPPWVRILINEKEIILSEEEKLTISLLDIDNDNKMEAVFFRKNSFILLKKNGEVKEYTSIVDFEGNILDDFSWVDFWYVDDQLHVDYDPYFTSQGQVLHLIKESSGTITIYFENNEIRWYGI